jgi:hypothetical protein
LKRKEPAEALPGIKDKPNGKKEPPRNDAQ